MFRCLDLLLRCSELELLDPSTPLNYIEEVLDFQTVECCEHIYDYIESRDARLTVVCKQSPCWFYHGSKVWVDTKPTNAPCLFELLGNGGWKRKGTYIASTLQRATAATFESQQHHVQSAYSDVPIESLPAN